MMRKSNEINVKKKLIEATTQLIDEEGVKGVSIRKIASKAGYTSGTIYLYFEKIEELIFLSSLKYLKQYNENLESYAENAKNSYEENILVWRFFCDCSFQEPEIFHSIFFSSFEFQTNKINEYYELKDFYKIFPEEIKEFSSKFYPMLLKLSLKERNKYLIGKMVKDKYISPSHIYSLNHSQIFIYKGFLEQAMKSKNKKENDRIKRSCVRAIEQIYKAYLLSDSE